MNCFFFSVTIYMSSSVSSFAFIIVVWIPWLYCIWNALSFSVFFDSLKWMLQTLIFSSTTFKINSVVYFVAFSSVKRDGQKAADFVRGAPGQQGDSRLYPFGLVQCVIILLNSLNYHVFNALILWSIVFFSALFFFFFLVFNFLIFWFISAS